MVTENVTIVVSERGAAQTAASIRGVGTASASASGAVRALASALVALGGALATKQLLGFADAATQVNNRIKVSTKSFEEFIGVNRALIETSQKTRTDLESNAELFQRLRTATRDLGVSTKDVLAVTEGLGAAIAVSGANAATASAGLFQLGQGLASGRLQGDELRSILENLPDLATKLAKELGVTVGQLRALGEEGKLTADVVFPALLRASAGFADQLKTVNFTTEQTLNVLKNAFTIAVGAINNTLGSTLGLNNAIVGLSQNVGTLLVQAVSFGINAFADLVDVGASFLDLLDEFGIVLPGLGQTLSTIGNTFRLLLSGLEVSFRALIAVIGGIRVEVAKAQFALGLISESEAVEVVQGVTASNVKLGIAVGETNLAIDRLVEGFQEVAVSGAEAGDVADKFRDVAAGAREAADKVGQLKDQATIQDAFAGIVPGGDKVKPSETAISDALNATGPNVTKAVSELGQGVGDSIANNVGDALKGAMLGEGVDAATLLSNIAGDLVQTSLEGAIEAFSTSIAGAFDSLTGSLGASGGALGAAFSGALGVGIGLLSKELGGGSSSARNDLVQSATQSAQATRGVVAGPTSIPIFQVGQQLEAALNGTNAILSEILSAILSGAGAGRGGGTPLSGFGSAASGLSLSTASTA